MPEAREQNIKDVGRQVFQVDVDSFFARILPSVDDTEVTNVLGYLRTSGTLDLHTDQWVHFKDAGEPKHQSAYESVVFEPIGSLAREIIEVVQNNELDKEIQLFYDSRPNSSPESSECRNSSQPDGYFVLKTAETDLETIDDIKRHRWRNLTLISEFKKADDITARNDVRGFCALSFAY